MKIISIDNSNIDNEHICCAIGNDKINKQRAETKKSWLKQRFDEGLVFKRLDQRGKVFIEYMPIETVWKPILGKSYYIINCLWVSGQFKEKGWAKALLHECIQDAEKKKLSGIAVVTSSNVKPFLTDKKFFLKHGFVTIDTAKPYFELLVYKINENAPTPKFNDYATTGECANKNGFTFIFSNQCPFMEEYVYLLAEVLKSKNISYSVEHLKSNTEAQQKGSPFGTLGIYYKGKFVTHELMTEKKFSELVEKCISNLNS